MKQPVATFELTLSKENCEVSNYHYFFSNPCRRRAAFSISHGPLPPPKYFFFWIATKLWIPAFLSPVSARHMYVCLSVCILVSGALKPLVKIPFTSHTHTHTHHSGSQVVQLCGYEPYLSPFWCTSLSQNILETRNPFSKIYFWNLLRDVFHIAFRGLTLNFFWTTSPSQNDIAWGITISFLD